MWGQVWDRGIGALSFVLILLHKLDLCGSPRRTRTCDHSINSLQLLDDRLSILGDKVGPILFQLPPDFAADAGRLGSFVTLLVDLHSNLRLGPIG